MHTCLDCNQIFEEPRLWIERHGLDSPPYEEWSGCPNCGGSYVDTLYCDDCGAPIIGDYIELSNGDIYCENCFEMRNIED